MIPLISIITTVTDLENITNFVDNISNATASEIEFIIINDSLKPEDLSNLKKQTNVKIFNYENKLDKNFAFNLAVTFSVGTYIVSLSDTVRLLDQNKDVWLTSLLKPMIDEDVILTSPLYYGCGLPAKNPSYKFAAFKREAFFLIGGLDEYFLNAAEVDHYFKVLDYNKSAVKVEIAFESKIENHPLDETLLNLLRSKYGFISSYYNRYTNEPSDIIAHLPIIKEYASKYKHITEFGIRTGRSTVAICDARPDKIISYDIKLSDNIKYLNTVSKLEGINLNIIEKDVLSVDIEPTDLLMIDSKHTYSQLIQELNKHSPKVKHAILLHDTDTFGLVGEDDTTPSLIQAVEEFLQNNKEWYLKENWIRNNGFMILERKEPSIDKASVVLVLDNIDKLNNCLNLLSDLSNFELVLVIHGNDPFYRNLLNNSNYKFKIIWIEPSIDNEKAYLLGKKAAIGAAVLRYEVNM